MKWQRKVLKAQRTGAPIRLFGFDAYCLSSVKKNEVEKFEMGLKFVQED